MSSVRATFACAVSVTCLCAATPAVAQTQPPPDPNSFVRILKGTVDDFRRLPSGESVIWLTAGGTIAALGHTGDWNVTNGFSGSGRLRGIFGPGETIGSARAQLAGALATYTIGRISGNTGIASAGHDLIRAQILTQAMTAGIKMSARRNRPDGGEFSFPSGHSSVTFASATVLQRHYGWKAGIPAYAVASYVAASRVQVKRHFLSDVAFGAAIGIVAGRTVTIGSGRTRFAVSPSASPNGAGVSFTLLDKR